MYYRDTGIYIRPEVNSAQRILFDKEIDNYLTPEHFKDAKSVLCIGCGDPAIFLRMLYLLPKTVTRVVVSEQTMSLASSYNKKYAKLSEYLTFQVMNLVSGYKLLKEKFDCVVSIFSFSTLAFWILQLGPILKRVKTMMNKNGVGIFLLESYNYLYSEIFEDIAKQDPWIKHFEDIPHASPLFSPIITCNTVSNILIEVGLTKMNCSSHLVSSCFDEFKKLQEDIQRLYKFEELIPQDMHYRFYEEFLLLIFKKGYATRNDCTYLFKIPLQNIIFTFKNAPPSEPFEDLWSDPEWQIADSTEPTNQPTNKKQPTGLFKKFYHDTDIYTSIDLTEEQHMLVQKYEEYLTREYLGEAKSLLYIGCSNSLVLGRVLDLLPENITRIVVTDLSPKVVEGLKTEFENYKNKLIFKQMDLLDENRDISERFDCIMSIFSFSTLSFWFNQLHPMLTNVKSQMNENAIGLFFFESYNYLYSQVIEELARKVPWNDYLSKIPRAPKFLPKFINMRASKVLKDVGLTETVCDVHESANWKKIALLQEYLQRTYKFAALIPVRQRKRFCMEAREQILRTECLKDFEFLICIQTLKLIFRKGPPEDPFSRQNCTIAYNHEVDTNLLVGDKKDKRLAEIIDMYTTGIYTSSDLSDSQRRCFYKMEKDLKPEYFSEAQTVLCIGCNDSSILNRVLQLLPNTITKIVVTDVELLTPSVVECLKTDFSKFKSKLKFKQLDLLNENLDLTEKFDCIISVFSFTTLAFWVDQLINMLSRVKSLMNSKAVGFFMFEIHNRFYAEIIEDVASETEWKKYLCDIPHDSYRLCTRRAGKRVSNILTELNVSEISQSVCPMSKWFRNIQDLRDFVQKSYKFAKLIPDEKLDNFYKKVHERMVEKNFMAKYRSSPQLSIPISSIMFLFRNVPPSLSLSGTEMSSTRASRESSIKAANKLAAGVKTELKAKAALLLYEEMKGNKIVIKVSGLEAAGNQPAGNEPAGNEAAGNEAAEKLSKNQKKKRN